MATGNAIPQMAAAAEPPAESRKARSWAGVATVCLVLITAAAFGLRIYKLNSQGLNIDEGFSALMGRIPLANFMAYIRGAEFNMVLYYGLLRFWMRLGHSEYMIRMLSVLLATVTVPAVYLLGKRLFDRGTALLAALLLAVQPFHIMLGQRARGYPLAVLLICLASLFFLRGLQEGGWGNWLAYAVLAAAATYCHFLAGLVIGAQWVSLLLLPRRSLAWRWLIGSALFMAVLLVPAVFFLAQHPDASNLDWVAALNLTQFLNTLYAMTLSKGRSIAYLAMWAIAIWSALRLKPAAKAWPYRFTALWLLAPPLLVIGVSMVRPMLVERFLAICIPASVLLAAAGLRQLARWSKAACFIVLALIIFYSISNVRYYYAHPEYGENWREGAHYIFAHAQAGDEVVIMSGMPQMVFDYYREMYPGNIPEVAMAHSTSDPMPQPLPKNVWFIGWTDRLPYWDTEVEAFREQQMNWYCNDGPVDNAGVVKVWQFRECGGLREIPSP